MATEISFHSHCVPWIRFTHSRTGILCESGELAVHINGTFKKKQNKTKTQTHFSNFSNTVCTGQAGDKQTSLKSPLLSIDIIPYISVDW